MVGNDNLAGEVAVQLAELRREVDLLTDERDEWINRADGLADQLHQTQLHQALGGEA